jgi:hypothetical protein
MGTWQRHGWEGPECNADILSQQRQRRVNGRVAMTAARSSTPSHMPRLRRFCKVVRGADQCVAEALQMRPIVGRAAMFFAKVMSECVTTAAVGA